MGRFADAWRLLNLPCEGMSRLSSESLDRDLGGLERVALRSHLLYCVHCRRFDRQIKVIDKALHHLALRVEADDPLPGPDLPAEVREEIKRRLRED